MKRSSSILAAGTILLALAVAQETLTNESVIKLMKSGLAETLIVNMVRTQPGKYSLDVDRVLELKNAGVSEAVMAAIVARSGGSSLPSMRPPTPEPTPEPTPTPAPETGDLDKRVKEFYDGKTLVVAVPGLLAGEYQKQTLGPGQAGLVFYNFHSSIGPLPKSVKSGGFGATQLARLNQFDERSFTELKSGLNVTKLVKGEQVRVNKFYMRSNYVDLHLEPLDPSHLQDLDYNKASRKVSGSSGSTRVRVAGFGLRCLFYFNEDTVITTGDFKTISEAIGKYFLPATEAARLKAEEDNVELNIGMSEEDVLKKLGQPLRTIKVGTDKVLKYNDLSVTLKEGKVAEVKVN